ncbi:efflux RND transporter periplasmic adaptor subunit [Reichenbachiella ulvae]|uniref:Efflux RND transporter periplasmic adaptor subunit n=1 Tax=Reichenbachiella ulvae TaxID=2980104 RepID=A0ABT3CY43_9BACT|nr:efflux RND transporter periplasmic adaptor subunit [Reichenbachiella ulvae]MCV9388562.1 efflux RND transporter periplasmic adaptor subunit [Reichenbachiella ulvae]
MNQVNNKIIGAAVLALALGLGLGWFLFSTDQKVEEVHTHESKSEEWTCSMHPQIRQSEPGQCPICGMDLIPVGSEGASESYAIKMSPTAMQLADVQTAIVQKQTATKELRLSGKVQVNEQSTATQTSHMSGRLESLRVNTTGEYVSKGQVIASLYSPELVAAQRELFEAQKMKDKHPELFEAAQQKLLNWKLSKRQIDQILKAGKPMDQLPILADKNGIVIAKKANQGDYVKEGQALYDLANLNSLWVLFDVYEQDMPWVKQGDSIRFEVSSLPGKKFEGRVNFIDPVINPQTRVAQARVVVSNPDQQLKPEMFVTGWLNSPLSDQTEQIAIPKSAVMWTGKRSVVYVKESDSESVQFASRKVTLGSSLGDSYVILEGLEVGEEIAVHGTFSIDAAAQLAGKPSMMNAREEESVAEEKPITTQSLSEEGKRALQPLIRNYLDIKSALADDDFARAQSESSTFSKKLSEVEMKVFKGESHMTWMESQTVLMPIARALAASSDITSLRNQFIQLSDEMIELVQIFQPYNEALYIQHCPMANSNQGADWISSEKEILNPYYGASMLKCGEVKQEITKN